jgi:hypothetical protein
MKAQTKSINPLPGFEHKRYILNPLLSPLTTRHFLSFSCDDLSNPGPSAAVIELNSTSRHISLIDRVNNYYFMTAL